MCLASFGLIQLHSFLSSFKRFLHTEYVRCSIPSTITLSSRPEPVWQDGGGLGAGSQPAYFRIHTWSAPAKNIENITLIVIAIYSPHTDTTMGSFAPFWHIHRNNESRTRFQLEWSFKVCANTKHYWKSLSLLKPSVLGLDRSCMTGPAMVGCPSHLSFGQKHNDHSQGPKWYSFCQKALFQCLLVTEPPFLTITGRLTSCTRAGVIATDCLHFPYTSVHTANFNVQFKHK